MQPISIHWEIKLFTKFNKVKFRESRKLSSKLLWETTLFNQKECGIKLPSKWTNPGFQKKQIAQTSVWTDSRTIFSDRDGKNGLWDFYMVLEKSQQVWDRFNEAGSQVRAANEDSDY